MLHLFVITLGLFCAGTDASVIKKDQQVLRMNTENHGENAYKLSFGDHKLAFEDWKMKFAYMHGENWDEAKRFIIFSENVAKIEQHNWLYHTKKSSFYMGLNQFTAMTNDEYQRYNNLGKYSQKLQQTRTDSSFQCVELSDDLAEIDAKAVRDNIPDAVDWTQAGYVTPVKNQGQCGSCWSFSATGSLEGAYFKTHNELVSFSEQQILDCCQLDGCGDCHHGGYYESAFEYIHNTRGLETEDDYPYQAYITRNCKVSSSRVIGNLTTCYKVTPSGSEDALKRATAMYGPISVSIDAKLDSFKHYTGGVYHDPQCSSDQSLIDHAVLVTGYGTSDDNQDYWIIKNSWGEIFGMSGYIWIARNHDNLCGVAYNPVFPVFN